MLPVFLANGHLWLRRTVSAEDCTRLASLAQLEGGVGQRVAPRSELTRAVVKLDLMAQIKSLHPALRPVRMVGFDKTPDRNWALPWHQDRVIAVADRVEVEGVSNWSRKSGVWHCEPCEGFLNRMVFARLHLDTCDAANGAMEYALGSHARGLVSAERAEAVAKEHVPQMSVAAAGDVLLLPMLTLHRSRPSGATRPRRALRIDFAMEDPPCGLVWAY